MTVPCRHRRGGRHALQPAAGLTIVGVVEQARLYNRHQNGLLQLDVRSEDWLYRPLSLVVPTEGAPDAIVAEVAALVGLGALIGVSGLYAGNGLISRRAGRDFAVGSGHAGGRRAQPGTGHDAACYLPAQRVLGLDPAQAFRQE